MNHDTGTRRHLGVVAAAGSWPRDEIVVALAAQEARRRRLPLTLLHVQEDTADGAGLDVLARARDAARRLGPGDRVHTCHLVGSAPTGLVRASRRAELVVLGAEGGSPITRLLRGEVTANVAARARSLVEVVPTGDGVAPGAPVVERVVAVSCGDGDIGELARVAFDQAERYAAPLYLMRAGEEERPELVGRLEAALARWRRAHPVVDAEVVMLPGPPPAAVLHQLEATDLVVAMRGTGASYWGRPDGITRALLDRGPCPVVVVPPAEGGTTR
ncbi:universal stress protein [Nocardioides sp. W7]|uniref:universal stress protein n=1 Tax=Nocardioides sp. W7 TaxID=2931390 RepID=UPI001FD31AC1|nr:universal stress protein [Nocardioides sp. W7]